jgi:hypothetical protein
MNCFAEWEFAGKIGKEIGVHADFPVCNLKKRTSPHTHGEV